MSSTPMTFPKDDFKGKYDPLWSKYVEEANKFDKIMVEDWNKIIDVILVFVALFISVLTTFVVNTSTEFQRDPSTITNDLLLAIYQQLAARANNETLPVIDPSTFFNQSKAERSNATFYNLLLYCSLALSIVVSVVALVAKLWLVNYGHRILTVSLPYDKAMKRQKAFSGLQAWNLNATIHALPLGLIIAVVMFAIFITTSVRVDQPLIGIAVGAIIAIGFVGVAVVSIVAAFVPSCPYRSSIADAIELVFSKFDSLLSLITTIDVHSRLFKWLRGSVLGLTCLASGIFIPIVNLRVSTSYFSLVCFPIMVTYAVVMKEEWTHSNPKYQPYNLLPKTMAISYLIITPILTIAGIFCDPKGSHVFFGLYSLTVFLFILSSIFLLRISKSPEDTTGELDAIIWLLESQPSPDPFLIRKVHQIVCKSNLDLLPGRILDPLFPLLSALITGSDHNIDQDDESDEQNQNLKIYLDLLNRIANVEPQRGLWLYWPLNENPRLRPPLDDDLRRRLLDIRSKSTSLEYKEVKYLVSQILDKYERTDDRGYGPHSHPRHV